jgi:predicted ATPase
VCAVVDRDTFVGREPELADLERRLASARAGSGTAVLVEADPGMGKTALAHELTRRARRQDFATAWGACLEGEGAPAYRPWSQILAELGRSAKGLVTPDLIADGGSRFRLFDDVVTALRSASARSGMLIVLDDLHWADVPCPVLARAHPRLVGSPRRGRKALEQRDPAPGLGATARA